VENRYSGIVTGPAPMFPRGYLLLIPVWYVVLAALLVIKGRWLPFWYMAIALSSLLIATLILAGVLATMRQKAFFADENGIWLGIVTRRKRSRRQRILLPWSHIAQLRITDRHYGARLEIVLSPAASIIGRRHHIVSGIFFAGVTVIIPPRWIGRRPALLSPRAKSPQYRVPLCDTAVQLGAALSAIAPPTVQVTLAG
jgi:hypothetical protein